MIRKISVADLIIKQQLARMRRIELLADRILLVFAAVGICSCLYNVDFIFSVTMPASAPGESLRTAGLLWRFCTMPVDAQCKILISIGGMLLLIVFAAAIVVSMKALPRVHVCKAVVKR